MTGGPRVLVTGALGPAGSSLLAQLDGRHVETVAVDMAAGTGGRSRPVHAVPAARDHGYLPALLSLIGREAVTLVIPTVSEELPLLAVAAAPRVLPARVEIGSPASVGFADDKLLTCRALEAEGVAVPRFVEGHERASAVDVAVLGTPYLSKPRVGRGGRSVAIHDLGTWPQPSGPGLVLQEFVPGQEYSVNAYRAAPDTPGDPLPAPEVLVVLVKRLLKDGRVGNALQVERIEAPDVARLAHRAMDALDLTGPADIDIRRRSSGEPVVLEVNARFGAHSAHAPEVLDALLACHRTSAAATPATATAPHR